MLSQKDTDWIKSNRKEITKNRTISIGLIGSMEKGKHPITGEPELKSFEEETKAIVYEIESAFKTDIDVEEGIYVEKGDLWVTIDIDDFVIDGEEIDFKNVEKVRHSREKYTVLSADRSGLGKVNRVIILARKDS